MKTAKDVQKRIERYSIFAAAILATGSVAKGEIIHTNLDPDESVDNGSYLIDFDGDGNFDISISHSNSMSGGFTYNRIYATGLSAGADVAIISAGASSAALHNYFDPIGAAGNFADQGLVAYYFDTLGNGQFSSSDEGYIGIRFTTIDGIHYGWVRIDINPNADGFVMDAYGYDDKAGKTIKAGDIECVPPVPTVEILSPTKVRLSWLTPEGAGAYKIRGRKLGDPDFTKKLFNDNLKNLNGLMAGASYEWQIRSFCFDSTVSNFTPLDTFTMPSMRSSFLKDLDEAVAYISGSTLFIQSTTPIRGLRLYDMAGREVFASTETITTESFQLKTIAAGAYLLELYTREEKSVRELIKQY